MRNPFTPPGADVADIPQAKPPSWPRTLTLVAAFSGAALAMAWVIVPVVAAGITQILFGPLSGTPPEFLALDLALSFLAFLAASYGAAALSRGHPVGAATGVGVIGWLVYFLVVGGLEGMFDGAFPLWYQLFPIHFLAAVVGCSLARQRAG